MSGFVASPPPPVAGSADEVAADGWYPAVSIAAFRTAAGVGTEVTPERARDALLGAMVAAMNDLRAWRDGQSAAVLADVPDLDMRGAARTLGGQPRLVQLWRRAVTSYAMADLLEARRTASATPLGRDRVEQEIPTADDHRRNGLFAVRDMIGRTRNRTRLL